MRISIHPEGLTAYAATTTVLAADLAAATTRTATPDLLALAFGLVGADFLTAYAAAHTTHVATLTDLSAILAAASAATGTAVTTYTAHDDAHAAAVRAAATELDA
ncbi:type VII secretion target [Nocardia tengchongensis]|uniref:type VII secretion target n=1 Tax=Nocardia tengchongensis TaxID=2055889 RepID=UPI0033DEBF7D